MEGFMSGGMSYGRKVLCRIDLVTEVLCPVGLMSGGLMYVTASG